MLLSRFNWESWSCDKPIVPHGHTLHDFSYFQKGRVGLQFVSSYTAKIAFDYNKSGAFKRKLRVCSLENSRPEYVLKVFFVFNLIWILHFDSQFNVPKQMKHVCFESCFHLLARSF